MDLCSFTCRTAAGQARAEALLGRRAAASIEELVECRPDLILLTVPDDALPETVGRLEGTLIALNPDSLGDGREDVVASCKPAVGHTSGATSVEVLGDLARLGCLTFVLHPLQTFSDARTAVDRLPGSAFAVTPGGPGAYELGAALARTVGGRPFLLEDEKRPVYHAAAVFASNYLVGLLHVAEELFVAAGLHRDEALPAFLPLSRSALGNVAATGAAEALTGPLARGDSGTIARHISALSMMRPDLASLYRHLGGATLDLVQARGELANSTIDHMRHLLAQDETRRS
jgi:predicted short-subunit dehydrogenase-like oxidoreductase (DUF2520 family)